MTDRAATTRASFTPVLVRARVAATSGGHRRRRRPINDTTRAISQHPLFSHCTRREVRQIARRGDIVDVAAGIVLWREGSIGYWFLAILAGTVDLRTTSGLTSSFGPGTHLGADAIISFGPEAATAVARSPLRAFVVGRRDLLELVHHPHVRAGLGLPEDERAYAALVRGLRAQGDAAWRALPKRLHPIGREQLPASFRVYERPRRLPALLPLSARPEVVVTTGDAGGPLPARAVAIAFAVVALLGVGFAFRFHPPVAIPAPGAPVDALDGVEVDGAPVHRVSGRYLVLSVEFRRPTLAGLALAVATGERWIDTGPRGGEAVYAAAAARRAFVESQATAARLAITTAGLDPERVRVHVPDRPLAGPSAGLVYSLAIRDLLDEVDRSRGRTIAATGAVDDSRRVSTVWFVREKARAAGAMGADVLLLPSSSRHEVGSTVRRVVPVATLDEAVAALDR